jgi:hypothetical protein
MKKTLILLAATTALSAAIAAPTWSAMRASNSESLPFAAVLEADQDAMPLILASSDDDDDRKYRNGARYEDDDDDDNDRKYRSGSRHDDDDDDNGDDCDDDDDDCGNSARNAAPAGTVAPPQNGLFGNGAAPKVQMN